MGDKGERRLKGSFICAINYFNGLSPITVIPMVRRAGVQMIRATEKPRMVIIINTHNINEPGRRTPRVLFYTLLVYGPVALFSGASRRRLGSSSGQEARRRLRRDGVKSIAGTGPDRQRRQVPSGWSYGE